MKYETKINKEMWYSKNAPLNDPTIQNYRQVVFYREEVLSLRKKEGE
jgi:hypothetical protein